MESSEGAVGSEQQAVLHEEINRLSRSSRLAIILRDVEGHPPRSAAWQLGWSVRRLESRRARAIAQLRARLARRGVDLDSRGVSGLLQDVESTPSGRLIASTVAIATRSGSRRGEGTSGVDRGGLAPEESAPHDARISARRDRAPDRSGTIARRAPGWD